MRSNIMTWIKTLLVLILVSSIFGFGATEESESEKPRETYVSPAEETIRLLIRSGRKFEQGVEALKNDLRSLTSFLPQPNNTIVKKPTIGDVLNPFKFRIKAIYPGKRRVFRKFRDFRNEEPHALFL